jgi:hypothetical protein
MKSLIDAVKEIMIIENNVVNSVNLAESEHHFIEILTFSSPEEIRGMLDVALSTNWMEFPVWARNLAFRLVCILEPYNADIRRRAAIDLRSFGPDWDKEADRLDQEAERILKM